MRHHTGSGRRPVIPAGWQAHHATVMSRAVADAACTVSIAPPPAAPTWNPVTKKTETVPSEPVYVGGAIIAASPTSRDPEVVAADEPVTVRTYELQLDVTASGIAPGQIVTVTECADPGLVDGARLTVAGAEYGSERFTRLVFATLNT